LIDSSKANPRKLLVYSFLQRGILGIAAGLVGPLIPFIARDLNTGLDRIGAAISFSVIAIFVVAIILNNVIDILGYRWVLIIGIVLISCGALGIFLSKIFILFALCYFLYVLGAGILSITIFSIIGNIHFAEKSFRIMQTSIYYSIGSIISPLLVSLFTGFNFHWQYIFLGVLILQVALSAFMFTVRVPLTTRAARSLHNIFKLDKKIMLNPFFIIIGLMILFYSAVMDTFFTWFTSYFEALNVSVSRSSLFLAIYALSLLLGLLLKNRLIKIVKEINLLMWGFLLSLAFMLCIFFIDNLVIKNVMLFIYGICITGNFTFLIIIALNFGPKYAASIATYTHALAYLGSVIFQYVSGALSEHISKNSVFYIDIGLLFVIFILSVVVQRGKVKLPE